jgi:sorting nexin-29
MKTLLTRVWHRVKIQNSLSEPFTTERGMRQGDALACMLFNITLEKAIRLQNRRKRKNTS